MTILEYLNKDLPFYHITSQKNIDNILKNGLKKGKDNPCGICVVRSKHHLVVEYITEMMIKIDDSVVFSIIEIIPSKHKLSRGEISNDHVVEATNPLHNYIRRQSLRIEQSDIIGEYHALKHGIPDKTELEAELLKECLIVGLEE